MNKPMNPRQMQQLNQQMARMIDPRMLQQMGMHSERIGIKKGGERGGRHICLLNVGYLNPVQSISYSVCNA